MEVRELARLVVLLCAVLGDQLDEQPGDDAGGKSIKKEIRALKQVYTERVRLPDTPPYHESTRGAAALERADRADAAEEKENDA